MGGQFGGSSISPGSVMPSSPGQRPSIGSLSTVASPPVIPASTATQEQRRPSLPAIGTGAGTGAGAGAGILLSDGTIFQFPSSTSSVTSPLTPMTATNVGVGTPPPFVGGPVAGQEMEADAVDMGVFHGMEVDFNNDLHGFPPPGSSVVSEFAWGQGVQLQQPNARPIAMPLQGRPVNLGLGTTPDIMGTPSMPPTPPTMATATGLGMTRRKRIVFQMTSGSSHALQSSNPNPNTPPLHASLPMLPSGSPLGSVALPQAAVASPFPPSARPTANPRVGTSSTTTSIRGGGPRTRARSGSSPGPWRPSSAMSSMSRGSLHRPWGHGSASGSPSLATIDAGRLGPSQGQEGERGAEETGSRGESGTGLGILPP